ncbi:hypothetical protein [Nocardioides speluncae]|uniref:hypothetical protein n=1 Tax=Nocardioides speluncae TaxID=2670337 RepID=UPI000D68E87F|nr:hypothetical protein [Nocardioides speluncae]
MTPLPRRSAPSSLGAALRYGGIRGVALTSFLAGSVLISLGVATLTDREDDDLAELISRHQCSRHAKPGAPSSALIRNEAGAVVQVPLQQGWAVRDGRQPGELLALCRGPATR